MHRPSIAATMSRRGNGGAMNVHASLYESYGGMANISRIVLSHYDRVVAAPELAPYFARTDMRALIEHQSHFLASVLGGPTSYTDADLASVHSALRISDAAFERMLALLEDTLREHGIADDHIRYVLGHYADRRSVIVTG